MLPVIQRRRARKAHQQQLQRRVDTRAHNARMREQATIKAIEQIRQGYLRDEMDLETFEKLADLQWQALDACTPSPLSC